ncbi:LytTR family DNA-binding domain-containing protein [Pedobacter cryoconitis]|uniref:LytTR family transcriptional regulator n=1 Tax=Pedobacter cryoconitis TaxID=188932 RepID=A0A327TAA3_9SPHI|nr:LytTR family DNA-binding domain-containing protein [Pedobacter cryoconitis]RAJ37335.1 LytTR family transcriptional regulator [Pedobacter cryoconitis]
MEIYINREHLFKEIEYPNRYLPGNLLKNSAVIFVVILLFLLLFKPFGVSAPEQKINYFFICALHALSPAIVIYTYFRTLNYLRKRSQSKGWTLLQEYKHIGIVLILTGIAGFLMRDIIYHNTDNLSWYYLWEELRNSLVAGSFFYLIFRVANFYFQSKKGAPFVVQFIPLSVEQPKMVIQSPVFIKTQVKQDDFSLYLSDLLFAKAEGNYIELTSYKDAQLSTELKRISLTQFNSQISSHPNFFRCHRAYLVNMLLIENVSGNAQGYLLAFKATGAKVPVSRAQLDSFNSLYEQLKQEYIT